MAYTYTPKGNFPWARFGITVVYLLIFTGVLLGILTGKATMSTEESNLIFLLAGALSTGLKDIVNWWFQRPGADV